MEHSNQNIPQKDHFMTEVIDYVTQMIGLIEYSSIHLCRTMVLSLMEPVHLEMVCQSTINSGRNCKDLCVKCLIRPSNFHGCHVGNYVIPAAITKTNNDNPGLSYKSTTLYLTSCKKA